MRLIGRVLVIVFAFVAASMAAAVVLAVRWVHLLPVADAGPLGVPMLAGFVAVYVSGLALLPMLLVVALAEGFALRSVLVYGAAGLGIGLFYGSGLLAEATPSAFREMEITAAGGIAGGLVYWALAGRNAGKWRETLPPPR